MQARYIRLSPSNNSGEIRIESVQFGDFDARWIIMLIEWVFGAFVDPESA